MQHVQWNEGDTGSHDEAAALSDLQESGPPRVPLENHPDM